MQTRLEIEITAAPIARCPDCGVPTEYDLHVPYLHPLLCHDCAAECCDDDGSWFLGACSCEVRS